MGKSKKRRQRAAVATKAVCTYVALFLRWQLLRGLLVPLRRAADSLFGRSLAFGSLSVALPVTEQRHELLFKPAPFLRCSMGAPRNAQPHLTPQRIAPAWRHPQLPRKCKGTGGTPRCKSQPPLTPSGASEDAASRGD